MAFTVEDFEDLLRMLDENPSWVVRLRKVLFDEAWEEVRQAIRHLSEQLDRHEAETNLRFSRVEADIAELKADVSVLKTDVAVLKTDVGHLKGSDLERRYRERAASHFGRHIRGLRAVDPGNLAPLRAAMNSGILTEQEWDQLMRIDLLIRGKSVEPSENGTDVYLVVEVSSVIDAHDVDRAVERAALLRRVGYAARPAVGGGSITAGAVERAAANDVLVKLTSDPA